MEISLWLFYVNDCGNHRCYIKEHSINPEKNLGKLCITNKILKGAHKYLRSSVQSTGVGCRDAVMTKQMRMSKSFRMKFKNLLEFTLVSSLKLYNVVFPFYALPTLIFKLLCSNSFFCFYYYFSCNSLYSILIFFVG